jgi:hypothetical protein
LSQTFLPPLQYQACYQAFTAYKEMANAEEDDGTLELEQSTQHLKDFKLAIEFKYLVRYSI